MITKKLLRIFLILAVVFINIGCDQVSKKIVRHSINPYETIHLLRNHLTVTRVENSGAFLSVGDSLSNTTKGILLSLLPLIALVIGFIYVLSKPRISNYMLAGFCFVLGGGVGNIFDRVMHGSVTDFLHIKFGFFQTGVFNMADVSIMIGVFIILMQAILKRKP